MWYKAEVYLYHVYCLPRLINLPGILNFVFALVMRKSLFFIRVILQCEGVALIFQIVTDMSEIGETAPLNNNTYKVFIQPVDYLLLLIVL